MPSVLENLEMWNSRYVWTGAGEEWSEQFGGTEALWWFILYPRIHRFLPVRRILEIAPGYGRWTQYLKQHCDSLVGVDLSAKCVEHCTRRFSADPNVKFYVNNGCSLSMVADESIDFVFSFDSLVHAEKDVIENYLLQIAMKLRPDGAAFIHHSNLGSYPGRLLLLQHYGRLPSFFRRHFLTETRIEDLLSINAWGWRASSMTAGLFREYCTRAGLKCVSQELFSWFKGECLIDAISVVARDGARWGTKSGYLENTEFVRTSVTTSRLAQLYCGESGMRRPARPSNNR
jgi:SAM-dependent methyltransferase